MTWCRKSLNWISRCCWYNTHLKLLEQSSAYCNIAFLLWSKMISVTHCIFCSLTPVKNKRVVKSSLPFFPFCLVFCIAMGKPFRKETFSKLHRSSSLQRHAQINTVLTTPTGKARTAIIQSRREMSFFSCLSCSWLSFPLVRRLDRSVKTQIPKKTAWITCVEEKHTLEHILIFQCSFSWTEKTSPLAESRSDTSTHEEYCHRIDMGSGNTSVP